MKKGKRNYWWLMLPGLQLTVISNAAYILSKDIMEEHSPLWMVPLVISVIVAVIVIYKHFRTSILRKIIRNEPIMVDRSNEVPYEFDNPYMPKQSDKVSGEPRTPCFSKSP